MKQEQVIDTFRRLSHEKKTGILSCERTDMSRKIVFRSGRVIAARSSLESERLGEIMVRHGRISRQHFADGSIFARKGKRMGEVLAELGVVRTDEVEAFVHIQVIELSSAEVLKPPDELCFTATSDVVAVVSSPVSIEDIIMEAGRRTPNVDEHFTSLMEDDRHLALSEASLSLMENLNLEPYEMLLLSQINGSEPPRAIFARSSLSREETTKALLSHLMVGTLELQAVSATPRPASPGNKGQI